MTEPTLEQKVLGIAFASPRDLQDLTAARVRPEHFQQPVNRGIWEIIQTLESKGEHVDHETVFAARHLADKMVASKITPTYLFECFQASPWGHVGGTYAGLLREQFDQHQTEATLTRARQLLDGGTPSREVRLATLDALQASTDDQGTLETTGTVLEATLKTFDQVQRFTPTPWGNINRAVRGWRPGGLYVIGARPGVGKSFMLQAAAISLAAHGPVVYESLEMPSSEIMIRMLAQLSGVKQLKMAGLREDGTSRLSPNDRRLVEAAATQIAGLPLAFGRGTKTVMDVRENARVARGKGPLAGIIVDYIQLVQGSNLKADRVQEVSQISRDLKLLAMEFDCPVLSASQLNRGSVQGNQRPTLTALRESGSIEQDADVVMLMEKPSWDEGPDGGIEIDVHVAKNRQGPTATAFLDRNGPLARIVEDPDRELSVQELMNDQTTITKRF